MQRIPVAFVNLRITFAVMLVMRSNYYSTPKWGNARSLLWVERGCQQEFSDEYQRVGLICGCFA